VMLLADEQRRSDAGTGQGEARHVGTNVPALITGWDKDGKAKVELLASAEGYPIGSTVSVGIRPDPKGRTTPDFTVLNKQGLRLGGMVLLRRMRRDGDLVTAKAAEILMLREADGAPFVIHNAATCLLHPPTGTAMVREALVAMFSVAVPARSLSEGITKLYDTLDQPGIFGLPGLFFFGRTKEGEPIELKVGGDRPMASKEMLARLLQECPKDIIQKSRTTGTNRKPWTIVPFFRAPVDPDRSSKISAQFVNHSYGSEERPAWTRGNVVLRAITDKWHVCDASPADEPSVALPFNDLDI